jgi:hypothetical protein
LRKPFWIEQELYIDGTQCDRKSARDWFDTGGLAPAPPRIAAENGCVLDRRLEHRRPWEGDVPNDLKIRLESLREAETTRLQRLLALKRMGASLEYDDGRKLDDLLEEAKTAIRNLDQSINELGKAS